MYKAYPTVNIPPAKDAHFCGKIEEKFKKVICERAVSDSAQNLVFKEAEDAFFAACDGENAPVGLWQGEFWGKLTLGACRIFQYTQDEKLKEFILKSTHKILSYQREDGYLGTYRDEKQIFRVNPKIAREITGFDWDCDWTWNIWCRKYTIWALIEVYEISGDKAVLDATVKTANQLIDMLDEMGAKICETGTFFGLPSGSIMKPMVLLYEITGNKKYLDFALEIANQWEDDETCCVKIIKNSLNMLPVHLWNDKTADIIPKSKYNPYTKEGEPVFDPKTLYPELSYKVYEMISCFDGILELYRVTGTQKYLDAAKNFFELIIKYEYNTLFSVGFNDLFLKASKHQNSITELCDVIHFIRLLTELHRMTGETKYLDYAEKAFYNPFLAGVAEDGTTGARGVRGVDGHMFEKQIGCEYNHCCTNNMPRAFINFAQYIATSDENTVYLNFFSDATVTLHPTEKETVKVQIGGGYLERCTARIEIDAEILANKKLMIRVPSWSKKTEIKINGSSFYPENGKYFETGITSGKTEIDLCFDNRPQLCEKPYNLMVYPTTPYMECRYFSPSDTARDVIITENKATLCVGAVLLALSRDLESTKEEIIDRKTVFGKNAICTATAKNSNHALCEYDVTFTYPDGTSETLPMCDFASASDKIEHKDYRYTIFI